MPTKKRSMRNYRTPNLERSNMPKYDYKCNACGGQQELERSIHAEADSPVCCNQNMERMFSVPGVQFKGGGWGGQ
jgi:putative FmdB family regulatory protein